MSAEDDLQIFSKFLSENSILIADTNASARASLASVLIRLGASPGQVALASGYDDAEQVIAAKKPRIIFCDFYLGTRSGIDLLQDQRKFYADNQTCLFVVVSNNTSQAAVARAAEEDVDTFILKPYTMESLKRTLLQAVVSKLRPSDYMKLVLEGKQFLVMGQIDRAIELFDKAIDLDPKPTLACFYRGQAEVMKEALQVASSKFKEGLSYNKIHYKCLTGLYDILLGEKRYDEAYDVVKRVAQYFPANPKRLASVLRLAILTKNYEDIESYYRLFVLLDSRSEELVRYICSALNVTGKYYLSRQTKTRALELFEKSAVSSAGRTKFIRYIIETLLDYNMVQEAAPFLKRFPPESHAGEDYLSTEYVLKAYEGAPRADVIQNGRKLVARGIESSLVYEILITHSVQAGYIDASEELFRVAIEKWPENRARFDELVKGIRGPGLAALK